MTLFITANDNERAAFLAKLNNQNTKAFDDGIVCKYGVFGKYKVAHYHSPEQGNAAELKISQAIKAVKPTYVIIIGIACGGNSSKQEIGDVLVSHNIIDYDCRKENYSIETKVENTIWRGVRVPCGDNIYGLFNGYYLDWQNESSLKAYFGDIISSNVLLNNPFKKTNIFALFNNEPIGYEMEGAGVFRACHNAKITEWILVKGICDFGDGYKNENKQKNQEFAANNAVLLCLYVFSFDGILNDIVISHFSQQKMLRQKLRKELMPILLENQQIFENYGPTPVNQNMIQSEYVAIWNKMITDKIIPNSEHFISLLDTQINLLSADELNIFEKYKMHIHGLKLNHDGINKFLLDAPKFPSDIFTILK